MAVNKVVFGDQTLIDISDSTVTAGDLRDGVTAYKKDGTKIIGSLSVGVTVTNFSGTVSKISGTVDDYLLTIKS